MTRRRLTAFLLATTGLVVAVTLPAAARTAAPTEAERGPSRQVNFVSACRYSHSAADDPIVFPGQPGAAHQHDFFANRTTDAASTYDSLVAGTTTCRRPGDTAAYWTPALLDDDRVVPPSHVLAYYLPAGKDLESIRPFPNGLRVVTDATVPNTRWACVGSGVIGPGAQEPPVCPSGQHLVVRIHFPDCWDGANVDSADHRSHMASSRRGRCPSSHPVPVPKLRLSVHYPASDGGPDVRLSSGGPDTAHADFFNAWDPARLARLVEVCLNAGVHCGQRGPR